MRIALISDIHGNDIALAAVLDDIEREGVDHIVCLGDVATLGPHPDSVIQTLRHLECPCVQGNHDAFLLEPHLVAAYTDSPVVVDSIDWCRQHLSPDNLAFLRTFQPRVERRLGTQATLLCFHGSPRSHSEEILATTFPDQLDEVLADYEATVMGCGHTHVQMLRQHRGTLIVNPGSVGLPFKEFLSTATPPTLLHHAEYATVEVDGGKVTVSLRRVPFDISALCDAARESTNPYRSFILQQYALALSG